MILCDYLFDVDTIVVPYSYIVYLDVTVRIEPCPI